MKAALRNRLARLERRREKPQSTAPIGLSALLALAPVRPADPSTRPTEIESAWMRENSEQLAQACPYRKPSSLADALAFAKEQLATARKMMAAETDSLLISSI